jgi:hypothetical protein
VKDCCAGNRIRRRVIGRIGEREYVVRVSLSTELGKVGVERGPFTLVNHPLLVDRRRAEKEKVACPKANRGGVAALASK